MTALRYTCGILSSIFLIIALLIGSVELCCFYQRDFYKEIYEQEKSYETVGITLDDEVGITDFMLDYLQGDYPELTYQVDMFGVRQDFFNERVRLHMIDVRNLNLGAVSVMKICFELSILFLLLMLSIAFKISARDYAHRTILTTLSKSILIGTLIIFLILGIGTVIAASDFNAFWTRFHKVFFTNDLWLLDPSCDYLVNITTESLFAALVLRIAIVFAASLLMLLTLSLIYLILASRKKWILKFGIIIMFLLILPSGAAHADSLQNAPEITSDYAILIDASTGQILYEKNAYEAANPASTTKVMTALLALENLKPDQMVSFSKKAIYALTSGASHIGMKPGEELSVTDCLYGLLLPSANEVANALAEAVSGDMDTFAELMNKRAVELGCVNTHFSNPNGLHSDDHKTCAFDLAMIFRQCIATPEFIGIDSKTSYVIGPTNLVEESRPMKTTHKMLLKSEEYYDSRVVCGKTGHTDQAGGCLITYAKSGGRGLICVVLHATSPSQYTDTKALLDHGFTDFKQTSADTLSNYLFGSKTEYLQYTTSASLPIYTIASDEPLLLPNDLSEIEWSIVGENVILKSGSLSLASVRYTRSSLDGSIYPDGLKPIDKVSKLQPVAKKSFFPYILSAIGVLLVLIIVIILRSRAFKNLQKKKSIHYIKNPGTHNIKIR